LRAIAPPQPGRGSRPIGQSPATTGPFPGPSSQPWDPPDDVRNMTPARLGGFAPRVFTLLTVALIGLALHASASSATTPKRQAPGRDGSNKVKALPPVGWSQGPSLPQPYLTGWTGT